MNEQPRAPAAPPGPPLHRRRHRRRPGRPVVSHCLQRAGVDHVVIEKHRIGHGGANSAGTRSAWSHPTGSAACPAFRTAAPTRTASWSRTRSSGTSRTSRALRAAAHEGVAVDGAAPRADGRRSRSRRGGRLHRRPGRGRDRRYHVPAIPRLAERLPAELMQLHSPITATPASCRRATCWWSAPASPAARSPRTCTWRAARSTCARRRAALRAPLSRPDVVDWLDDMGYYSMPVHEHPLQERVRDKANHYVTGRDGGRDIDLRAPPKACTLRPPPACAAGRLEFAPDLDRISTSGCRRREHQDPIDKFIADAASTRPTSRATCPSWEPPRSRASLDLPRAASDRRLVHGFPPDYRWIESDLQRPRLPATNVASPAAGGLYFLGLPWLYTWGSGRFSGVATDAAFLGDRITARLTHTLRAPPARSTSWRWGRGSGRLAPAAESSPAFSPRASAGWRLARESGEVGQPKVPERVRTHPRATDLRDSRQSCRPSPRAAPRRSRVGLDDARRHAVDDARGLRLGQDLAAAPRGWRARPRGHRRPCR